MVSTRIVIGLAAFLLFLALGSGWLAFESSDSQYGYTTFDIGSAMGSVYGPCGCPPSNSSIDGRFWQVMVPLLVAPGALSFAFVAFPTALILAVVSLFRWKLMVVAGALSLLSGILWIVGVFIVQAQVVHGLDTWFGYGGRSVSSSVWAQAGAYIAIVSGVVLLAGYALSRMEILDSPID